MALSFLLCATLIVAEPSASQAAAQVTSPKVAVARAVVERSLPFIIAGGRDWIENKKCLSCHRVGPMVWSLRAAAERGFAVDRKQLQGWVDWSLNSLFDESEKKVTGAGAAVNADGLSQLLLGLSTEQLAAEDRERITKQIVAVRRPDGSWKPEGQLPGQKRPGAETTAVSTMWQALALLSETPSGKPGPASAAEEVEAAVSTEWWVVRLVLSHRRGDAAETNRARDELLKQQRDDGGWGWLREDESDALATGMALYALGDAGLDGRDSAIARGWKFLAGTQRADGGWDVRGTKKVKQKNVEETASYWGATWAVIGIVETLPE